MLCWFLVYSLCLCNHLHGLILECCHHPSKTRHTFSFPLSQPSAVAVLLSASVDLPVLFVCLFINLFYFCFWLHWVFVAVCRLSLVVVSGGYSSLWCVGFSLRWLLLLRSTGSRCVGFSSCGTWVQ